MTMTMTKTKAKPVNITVIHGSILIPGANPGDIDIAHTGKWTKRREDIVRAFVADRGLNPNLPLDLHHQVGDEVTIPCLGGCRPEIFVLEGEEEVVDQRLEFAEVNSFPTALRAVARGIGTLNEWLAHEANQRLSILKSGQAYLDGKLTPGWDKYVCGIVALRNAASHIAKVDPNWLNRTACPNLLARLLVEDPVNWRAWPYYDGKDVPSWGEGHSAAATLLVRPVGEGVAFLGYDGKTIEVSEEEAIRRIFC